MDKVEIKILKLEVLERFFECWTNMLRSVVGVPELGCNPKVFAVAKPRRQRGLKSFPNLWLVAIITSAVEVAIADLDRLLNQSWQDRFFDFPHA